MISPAGLSPDDSPAGLGSDGQVRLAHLAFETKSPIGFRPGRKALQGLIPKC